MAGVRYRSAQHKAEPVHCSLVSKAHTPLHCLHSVALLLYLLCNLWLYVWKSIDYCQKVFVPRSRLPNLLSGVITTKWMWLAGTSRDHVVQPPCSNKTTKCDNSGPCPHISRGGDSKTPLWAICSRVQSHWPYKCVSQHIFVPGVVPPQMQDLALHEVRISPFLQPHCATTYEVNCYRIT